MDEKPNIQALGRGAPTQPMRPGQVARREFEYKRHGTVALLVSPNAFDGQVWGCCLDKNDHDHFLWALRQLARRSGRARRVHLIMDNGSSHIDHHTRAYLAAHSRLRPLHTLADASWLNRAELLLRAFTDRHLNHCDATSRQHLTDHLGASWPGYNYCYAHPFRRSWTRRDLHDRASNKGASICAKTYATVH